MIHTLRRTSTPAKIAFPGLEAGCWWIKHQDSRSRTEFDAAHNAGGLAKKRSEHMDNLHDWGDKVDQLAISVSIFLKLLRLDS